MLFCLFIVWLQCRVGLKKALGALVPKNSGSWAAIVHPLNMIQVFSNLTIPQLCHSWPECKRLVSLLANEAM